MKSFRILSTFLFIIIFYSHFAAQIVIDGTIKDVDQLPVDNAIVEIINADDTTNTYMTTTNSDGYFSLSVLTDLQRKDYNVPSEFLFLSNYPNPFNPSTIIYFELPAEDHVEIKIYDILGREVKTLLSDYYKSGAYEIRWNGRNNWNQPVSAGIYFCRLSTTDNNKVHKMVLLDGGSFSASPSIKKQYFKGGKNTEVISGIFNFHLRVKGEHVIETDFGSLTCSSDTTFNLVVPRKLISTTVGPSGGILGNDNFSLEIPEGAFTETTDLVLSLETDNIDFGDKTYSKLFRVDGLPEIFNTDLTLKIKVNESPEDSISIAIAELDSNIFFSNGFYNYDYYRAEYTDGYANLVIPSILNSQNIESFQKRNELGIDNYAKKLFIVLTSPGVVRSSKENFYIYYPKSLADLVPYIDEYLESAIDTVVKLGFYKLPLRRDDFESNWPAIVKLVDLSKKDYLLKSCISFTKAGKYNMRDNIGKLSEEWCINIDKDFKDLFSDYNILQRSLGANVFKLFLEQDELFSALPDNEWLLNLTTSRWSEKLFPFDENYINTMYEFENNELLKFLEYHHKNYSKSILDIVALGSYKTSDDFIPVIEYLTKYSVKKREVVYDLYNEIKNSVESKNSSVEGLMKLMDREENISLGDYYKKYLQGNIYNIPIADILKNVTETINFEDGDTLKFIDDQNWEFKDLSAKLFKIMINSDEIRDNGMLNFKLGPENLDLEYAKALVFGINGNSILFISEGNDFPVGNLNQYDGLLACIVNSNRSASFDGKTTIDMAIQTKVTKLPFEANVSLYAHFLQDLHIKDQYDEWDATGVDRITNMWNGNVKLIDDSTYVGNWDEEDQIGYNHKGDIKLIIDPDTKNLKYFEAEEIQDGDQFTLITESIISKLLDLQIDTEGYKKWDYAARNSEACSITNTFYYSSKNKYDSGEETMTQYYCDENSYIIITLDYGL